MSVSKSVVILHVLWSQPPFKAETSPLGIYFTVFIGVYFLVILMPFGLGKIRLSFFHVLWFSYL